MWGLWSAWGQGNMCYRGLGGAEGGLPSVAFLLGERAASEALPHGSKPGQVLSSTRLHRGPRCCFSHLYWSPLSSVPHHGGPAPGSSLATPPLWDPSLTLLSLEWDHAVGLLAAHCFVLGPCCIMWFIPSPTLDCTLTPGTAEHLSVLPNSG